MSNVYVVEYADGWDEHPDWKSDEFTDLCKADLRATSYLWIGKAVRMYIKERVVNENTNADEV